MFTKLFAVSCLAGAAIAVNIANAEPSRDELVQACALQMKYNSAENAKLKREAEGSNYFKLPAPQHAKAWKSPVDCGKMGMLYTTPTSLFTDHAGGRVTVSSHFKS
jgi:hypothetical protein